MRAVVAALTALALISVAVPADASQAQLERAQSRANRAARQLASAQTEQAEVEQSIAGLEARLAATRDALSTAGSAMRARAVQQYIRGAGGGIVLDTDLAASTRANALVRFVSLGDDDALDEYRRLVEDIITSSTALDAAKSRSDALVAELRSRTDRAFAELRKLERLEADRKAREARRRSAAGSTRRARSGPSFIAGNGSWMCPVQGPHAFSNDWGQPRSGGRSHQGNDILAPRGTPVVASVGGTVKRHNSGMGGLSYYLRGDDGVEYYGAHLDSYVAPGGHVAQGTVIGYVGNSGNARGGATHLHFEVHPGGGRPVNPYPTLRQYC